MSPIGEDAPHTAYQLAPLSMVSSVQAWFELEL